MVSRVKNFADYRKEIGFSKGLEEVLDYTPKHLLTKSEIIDKSIEKHVKVLNQYEEKRNSFQKIYLRKRIIYFLIVGIVTIALLALLIYFGIKLF